MKRGAPALAALLLVLAGGARAQVSDDYFYDEVYAPFFKADPSRDGWILPARPGSMAAPFEAVKPAGVLRVFIIGGSTAAGYGGAGDLSWGLAHALPGRRAEVINCGMSGYDSAREGLVLREALRHQPDIVVLLTGHNDFFIRRPLMARWRYRLGRALWRWRWLAAARERFGRRGAGASAPGDAAEEAERRAIQKALVERVDAHAAAIADAGARAVICVPPVDYEEAASHRLSPPWSDRAFADGWLSFLRGRPSDAEAAWLRSLDGPELPAAFRGAVWHAVGRARERQGRFAEAREALARALDLEPGSDVCGPACLEALRGVARRRGAVLADADAAFQAAAFPREPGVELFGDEIHWNLARHETVTRALVSSLRADPALAALGWAPPDGARPSQAETRKAEAGHREALLFYALQKMEFSSSNFSQRALEWLEGVERLEPAWTASPEALLARGETVYEHYGSVSPGARSPLPARTLSRARVYGYYGAMRLEQSRFAQAEAALRVAAEQERGVLEFRLLHAAAAALTGRAAAARADLAALRGTPQEPAARSLASALGLGAL